MSGLGSTFHLPICFLTICPLNLPPVYWKKLPTLKAVTTSKLPHSLNYFLRMYLKMNQSKYRRKSVEKRKSVRREEQPTRSNIVKNKRMGHEKNASS